MNFFSKFEQNSEFEDGDREPLGFQEGDLVCRKLKMACRVDRLCEKTQFSIRPGPFRPASFWLE
jgi:hypothetical protein